MNILTAIVAVVLILYCLEGGKKGLVEGLVHVVANILGILVIFVLAKGVGNFLQGSYVNVLIAFILLVAIGIIHKIMKVILDSLNLVSKLPIVNWANHVVGILLGFIRGIMLFWILFIVFGYFDIPVVNDWILEQVAQSVFLTSIYKTNLFVLLLLSLQ